MSNLLSTFLSTFNIVFWFLVLLVPLVIIHEFGHYLMCKLTGVKALEFGVGLPFSKRLFYKEWKGTVWSFYPWLLGGFVRPYGDNDALDQAYELQTKNYQESKEKYLEDRFNEILQNRDLEFFLKENNLEFDKEWQWFEKIANLQEKQRKDNLLLWNEDFSKYSKNTKELLNLSTEEQEKRKKQSKSKFLEKMRTIQTLIDWELDAKLQDARKLKQAFFAKTWWQQTLIILGGVTFNFLTAIFLFWLIFSFLGGGMLETYTLERKPIFYEEIAQLESQPFQKITLESAYPFILGVAEGSLAQKAGLKVRDQLVKIGTSDSEKIKKLQNHQELVEIVQKEINLAKQTKKKLEIVFISFEEKKEKQMSIDIPESNQDLKLGISVGYAIRRQAKNSLALAFRETWRFSLLNLKSLGDVLKALMPQATDRSAIQNVSGPIGVGYVGSVVIQEEGFRGALYLMAIISVSLAVFNLLPIPALDGGRLIIVTLNKITGKRNKKLEAIAISFTMILMLGLSILIAFKDVFSILNN